MFFYSFKGLHFLNGTEHINSLTNWEKGLSDEYETIQEEKASQMMDSKLEINFGK